MIRQAHTYLVGALSGVVVIGIAIAAFVVLVSAQVFHDLPIPALTSSDQKPAAVSPAKALHGSSAAVATTGGVSAGTTQPNHAAANRNAAGGDAQGGATSSRAPAHRATSSTPTHEGTGPAEPVQTTPTTDAGEVGSPTGGDSAGVNGSQPSSNSNANQTSNSPSSSSKPGSVGGGNSTSGSSGTSGAGNGTPTNSSGSSGGGSPSTGGSGGGGGGSTTTSPPATPVTTAKPSEAITESVNKVVGTVDEVTGGALSETGVSKVTEEVVNGVVGPESVVGKTVDGVGEVVGGLINGHGQ
ncbi:MAG TPA: hypothetical protein VHA80_11770 [Solirubrobacterales bacterium]|nr:hypothetical protein [Solirubrobacterales bacterium]